jgi:hypothetical protein
MCIRDRAGASLFFSVAEAELALLHGDMAGALQVATTLREQRPPGGLDNTWMRPWMLSLLLARKTGDAPEESRLVAALGEFAAAAPLSPCVTAPVERHCLALP